SVFSTILYGKLNFGFYLLNGFSCPISAPADLNQRNHPATQQGAAKSYNKGRKDFPIHILAAMKTKHLLQLPVLFALLFHSAGTSQPVLADANADTTVPLQAQPSVSLTIAPVRLSLNEMATATVSLTNVPAEGYTSAEFSCTYPVNLVQVSNIVVSGLFGPDPAIAIYDQQDGNFVVGIAGSQGNKANAGGPAFTFQVKGLGTGQVTLDCMARVSDGSNVLTAIGSDTVELTVAEATATPTLAPTACDRAEFIADVTIPPGTIMTPSQQFTKTWRLKNAGSCVWTTSYRLAFFSGEQMGAVSSAQVPREVAPGQVVDLSINMTAPSMPGSYRGYWIFQNATGQLFGIGSQGSQPWFVDILVPEATFTPTPGTTATQSPTPTNTPGGSTATPLPGIAYDFVAQAYTASWYSGAGQLPYPGIDGNPNGFAFKVDNPTLETGASNTRPGLLAVPQNVQNGYIQGFYPPFHVQAGDRFHTILSCESGATSCYAAYRLDYQTGIDPIRTFWGPFLERYDGRSFTVDVDLSALAGQDVKFILTILASGSATGDRMLWVDPVIYRTGTGPSATPATEWPTVTPSVTPILSPSPTASPIQTFSPTPTTTPTEIPEGSGHITGQAYADRPVIVNIFDANHDLVVSLVAFDGVFNHTITPGTYTLVATADGFLSASASVTITEGTITTMPTLHLPAGDVDNNNVIDQYDALTIGMNYNTQFPEAADLNHDGIINVLDLEVLARNYRKTGPVPWQG
ncbi:MAG TPA: NBR1-Ig-like domain-containing protein, partial [Anaerolineales bacterium]|nr:NBR1-Ig-like domain-containing protein [Anaerolineales bacterium]